MKYHIQRHVNIVGQDKIQITDMISFNNVVTRVSEQFIDTTNSKVRQCLIELGWTPPKEKK